MNPWEEYAPAEAGPWNDYTPSPSREPRTPDPATQEGVRNVVAGYGRGMVNAGRSIGQLVGAVSDEEIAEADRLDAPLMETAGGRAGSALGTLSLALPALAIPGVNSAVGAGLLGGAQGALLEPGSAAERAQRGAFGASGGLAGFAVGKGLQMGAKALVKRMADKMSSEVAQTTANAKVAQEAGYRLPPVTTNPTWFNRLMEGLAGKQTTAQLASVRNQEVTNRLARRSLGLKDDQAITPEVLRSVRQEASRAYQALDEIPITADVRYGKALQELTSRQSKASQGFPGGGPDPLAKEVQALWQPEFSGGQALAKISLLREQARATFRTDPSLARGLNGAADALEDVMDRNLQAMGSGELLRNYRTARMQIARAHTVERALNPATGNVSARELGRQLAKGKPLSGELKQAGQVGLAFPKVTAEVRESMPGVSPLDGAMVAGSMMAGAPAGGLAWLTGRPLLRNTLLSRPAQAALVPTNGLTNLAAEALQRPTAPNLLGITLADRFSQDRLDPTIGD